MAVKLVRTKAGAAPEYPQPGDVLAGKYRIERVIGEGGMGVVFAAHHELLDQAVAVKLLFAESGRDAEAVSRFLQEARAAAKLQSEHVARVMDIDTLPSGLPFIVMEYLDGSDLSELIDTQGPQAPTFVADCVLQALEALSLAHAQGIVHRDLKPSNLFLTKRPDGSHIVKILDFGISKNYGAKRQVHTLTNSRSVLGSPPYMSPEQVRSPRNIDLRTDIWSMGVVIYELLTAKMPFAGEEVGETFAAILEKTPEPVRALNPRVPEGLEAVVTKCLARDRDKRFSNVAEVAAAIAPFASARTGQSVERIRQTLARTDELSNPRGRAVSSSPMLASRVVSRDETVDASGPVEAREELSPTASTVRRDRLTLFGHSTGVPTVAGIVGLVSAFVVLFLGLALWLRSQRPTAASAPAKPPPIVTDEPSVAAATPAGNTATSGLGSAAAAAVPTVTSNPSLPAMSAPAPSPTTTALDAPVAKRAPAAARPAARPAPPPTPSPPKPIMTVTRPAPAPSPTQPVPGKDLLPAQGIN